jgi:hypothetical protein
MDTPPAQSNSASKLASFRKEFIDELPNLAREMIDIARAEETVQAYEKVMNVALKVVEGLQVQDKKDPYANLPVIHMTINGGTVHTQVEAAPAAPALPDADIEDVTPRVQSPFGSSASKAWELPDDPTEILPAVPDLDDTQATLNALDAAAGAMALGDD